MQTGEPAESSVPCAAALPWVQRPGECFRAYAHFAAYRDLGPGRSLLRAWRQQTGNERATCVPGRWTQWSQVHGWAARAAAYDAHLELQVRKQNEAAHIAELAAFRERARKAATHCAEIANAALLRAGERLRTLEPHEIEPGMVPAYLRVAAAVLDSSLNAEAEAIGVRRLETLLDNASDEDQASG